MYRRKFLYITAATAFTGMTSNLSASRLVEPEAFFFKDDGIVPNNKLPLLLYRNAFPARGEKGALWLEEKFHSNNWSNNWRNGVFTFQHYHSITHEVLGIYSGEVLVLLGGDKGEKMNAKAGDIIIIPAGVGHKNLGDSSDLGVVGAYPKGMPVDIIRCQPGDRPRTDENIAKVPLPETDPFLGTGGLIGKWG